MHPIIKSQIQLLIQKCEVILAKGDLDEDEKSKLENSLFFLRCLVYNLITSTITL